MPAQHPHRFAHKAVKDIKTCIMKTKLSISKTFQGAIIVSAFINGQYVDHQYMGYTIKEAKQLFADKYFNN